MRKSFDKAYDTTCVPDDIHYKLFKHLPESALQTLLEPMNDIWDTGDLQSIWKWVIVIPIPNLVNTIQNRGRHGRDRMVIGFKLPVQSVHITRRGVLDTTLCDKVC